MSSDVRQARHDSHCLAAVIDAATLCFCDLTVTSCDTSVSFIFAFVHVTTPGRHTALATMGAHLKVYGNLC